MQYRKISYLTTLAMLYKQWRRPGAEFGGWKNFPPRTKISEWRFFLKKSIFTAKISDDFFSHRPGFWDFPFLFLDFPCLYYVLNVVYDPFLTRKTTTSEKKMKRKFLYDTCFYSVHTFACIRQHYFLKYWGGADAWAVPHLKFWRDRPPSPP